MLEHTLISLKDIAIHISDFAFDCKASVLHGHHDTKYFLDAIEQMAGDWKGEESIVYQYKHLLDEEEVLTAYENPTKSKEIG